MELLEPVLKSHPSLSTADAIILGGSLVLEMAGAPSMTFCHSRVDAKTDGEASIGLQPRFAPNSTIIQLKDAISLMGLELRMNGYYKLVF